MVRLYTDLKMLDHSPRAGHPERPERLSSVIKQLDRTGLRQRCSPGICRPATDDELLRVHTPAHLSAMAQLSARGGGQAEADTWLSSQSESVARLAAGCVVQALEDTLKGDDPQSLCVVRPPGHHALADGPMGFCIYGSVAVAAATAIKIAQVNRILIVDWDVHHGNGTQDMFYENEQVGFFSIHRYPFYPGSGSRSETGSGSGLGSTENVPLPYGVSRQSYRDAFETRLEQFADRVKPEIIFLSAGFDAHAEDPVGDLGLEIEDFVQMTRFIQQVAATHAGNRIISVLEGGYNTSILAGCVAEHLRVLLGSEPKE